MRTQKEIDSMIDRFKGLGSEDIEGEAAEGIYETLLWLDGDRTAEDLAAFIPEA
jgi:hypothetical protein